jgi:hypothetical protein
MANVPISGLNPGAAVGPNDLFPDVQTVGVGPVKVTAAQIKIFTSNSPTLVTPNIGVATGTSLALGGASIGANSFAVNGTSAFNGDISFNSDIHLHGDVIFTGSIDFNGPLNLGTQQSLQGSLILSNTAAGAFETTVRSSNSSSAAWTFTLPPSAGTNGYILTTNGTGVSAWTNPTALGIDIDVNSTAITGGTSGRIVYDNAGTFGEISSITTNGSSELTVGLQQTTQGSVVLANTASGAYSTTLKSSNSATEAWTLTLPISKGTNGYILTTDGTGVSAWTNPTALGIDIDVNSTPITGGTSGRLVYDNAGTFGEISAVTTNGTGTLTIGTQQTTQGSLVLGNTAAGAFFTTLQSSNSASAAWTLTLPTTAGTNNYVLTTNGTGVSSWAQVSLTAGVTGTLPVANGGTGTSTAFTSGSIVFAGTSGVYSQKNANLFWDDSNNRLGINTATPASSLEVYGNAALGSANGTAGSFTTTIKTTTNWNFSTLDVFRNTSNAATPRFIGMPLDGDSVSSTTIGGYNAIWGAYDSAPTTGSTSSALNGAMVYGAYAGHRWNTNGSERMRIDSSGRFGFGTTPSAGFWMAINPSITGAVTSRGIALTPTVLSDVTTNAFCINNNPSITSAAFTLSSLIFYRAVQGTFGTGSITTSSYGFSCESSIIGATTNYGFYSNIAAPTSGGTASSTVSTIASSGTTTTVVTTAAHGLSTGQTVTVAATANATALVSGATVTILTVGSTDFTLIGAASNTVGLSFTASGAGTGTGTVTINQQGSGLSITVTNSTTFTYTSSSATYAAISTLTGTVTVSTRWNFYAAGSANNAFSGNSRFGGLTAPVATVDITGSVAATTTILSSGATSGIGYATGAGGAVTQATSRTTGVTLNKVSGQITLFSAAGSTAWQSFTVTNSAVASTDTVIVNQDTGTDLYQIFVTNLSAGSFRITFATTGGTTTEQPVFNFAVMKAVAA